MQTNRSMGSWFTIQRKCETIIFEVKKRWWDTSLLIKSHMLNKISWSKIYFMMTNNTCKLIAIWSGTGMCKQMLVRNMDDIHWASQQQFIVSKWRKTLHLRIRWKSLFMRRFWSKGDLEIILIDSLNYTKMQKWWKF